MKTFVVEIDGFIAEDAGKEKRDEWSRREGRDLSTVNSAAVAWLNVMYDAGHHICVFTTRRSPVVDITRRYLFEIGLKYSTLLFDRPPFLSQDVVMLLSREDLIHADAPVCIGEGEGPRRLAQ